MKKDLIYFLTIVFLIHTNAISSQTITVEGVVSGNWNVDVVEVVDDIALPHIGDRRLTVKPLQYLPVFLLNFKVFTPLL